MFVGDRGKRSQGYRENVEVDIGKMLKWIQGKEKLENNTYLLKNMFKMKS